MVGIWTLLVSLLVLTFVGFSARAVLRSGNQIAFVLAVNAILAALLGVVLNVTAVGELRPLDLILFCALPAVFAVAAWIVASRFPDTTERYERTEHA